MIIDIKKIKLWPSNEEITCPLAQDRQVVEVVLSCKFLDKYGYGVSSHDIAKVHMRESELRATGAFKPPEEIKATPPEKTVEDLLRELLEAAGVRFQE